jgi:hypothetical protein
MADATCLDGTIVCFGREWKDFMPLFGSLVVASTALFIGIFATARLNRSMKQTEFFLKFTERFHAILQIKHQLDLKIGRTDDEGRPLLPEKERLREANELYRQFFGLMFDEFFAYRHGFLDHDAYVDWMRWRNADFNTTSSSEYAFSIAGVGYSDGWRFYSERPALDHDFVCFMKEIHKHGGTKKRVEKTISKYGTWSQRLRRRIFILIREDYVLALLIGGFVISMLVGLFR